VASQAEIHARYGGVVPEIASRQHIAHIAPVVREAVEQAGGWDSIDAVAVTSGPGLAGSLIVGVNAARGIAAALGRPLIAVNHLEGHIHAAWIGMERNHSGDARRALEEVDRRPVLCLLVSGGHTELVLMTGRSRFRLLGQTRDDAAGEAFDKAARVLGLGYPGGPEIQRAAEGAPATDPLPRAWLQGTDDFSFSGLKTAVLRRAREAGLYPQPHDGKDNRNAAAALARAFQESVVDVLSAKTAAAAERHGCSAIIVAGGVAANRALRETVVARSTVPVAVPPVQLCTDNGAMIAMSGLVRLEEGRRTGWDLDVVPGLRIGA
jgi:N6-L-threonylcarbamoyladenine synthase